jgi:hypothetical protein
VQWRRRQDDCSGSKARQRSGQIEGGVEASCLGGSVELLVQSPGLSKSIGDWGALEDTDNLLPAGTMLKVFRQAPDGTARPPLAY